MPRKARRHNDGPEPGVWGQPPRLHAALCGHRTEIGVAENSRSTEVVAGVRGPTAIISAAAARRFVEANPIKVAGLIAARMARTGLIRKAPANWQDFHVPFPHDRAAG
jgi:hypothetical protein